MCGIAGFFYKNGGGEVPLGTRLTDMATVLGSRGLLYEASPQPATRLGLTGERGALLDDVRRYVRE